jgi:hypothetical protein
MRVDQIAQLLIGMGGVIREERICAQEVLDAIPVNEPRSNIAFFRTGLNQIAPAPRPLMYGSCALIP